MATQATFQSIPGMNPKYNTQPDAAETAFMTLASGLQGYFGRKEKERDRQQALAVSLLPALAAKGQLSPVGQGETGMFGTPFKASAPPVDWGNLYNKGLVEGTIPMSPDKAQQFTNDQLNNLIAYNPMAFNDYDPKTKQFTFNWDKYNKAQDEIYSVVTGRDKSVNSDVTELAKQNAITYAQERGESVFQVPGGFISGKPTDPEILKFGNQAVVVWSPTETKKGEKGETKPKATPPRQANIGFIDSPGTKRAKQVGKMLEGLARPPEQDPFVQQYMQGEMPTWQMAPYLPFLGAKSAMYGIGRGIGQAVPAVGRFLGNVPDYLRAFGAGIYGRE
jgi:hypothetical protein